MASKTEENTSVEKENNNEETSDKPLGVKFTYGIPGREVQNKNRVDLPPRPTNNAPKGPPQRGGGVAGRGFSRGRGQNYHNSHHRGGHHGHNRHDGQQTKPRNRPASPKTGGKSGDKEKDKPESSCDFCDRPCTEVICRACGYTGSNLRVKKECPKHPRIIRVLDLEVCPQCKTANIEEAEPEPEPEAKAEDDSKAEAHSKADAKADAEAEKK